MSAKAQARAAVIVVQFGDYDELDSCLAALLGSEAGSVVVVDNNSDDRFDTGFYAGHPHAQVLHTGENLGFAAGCNVGIEACFDRKYDYFIVLNSDSRITPEQVNALAGVCVEDPTVGIVGPVVFNESQREYYVGGRINFARGKSLYNVVPKPPDDPAPVDVDFVSGCGMMISRVALDRVGLFDEDYFLYWEDTDMSYRVRAAGFRTVIAPGIVMPHSISQTTGAGSPLIEYYMTRNGLRFFARHAPTALLRVALPLRVSASRVVTGIRNIVRGKRETGRVRIQGVLDYWGKRFKKSTRISHGE